MAFHELATNAAKYGVLSTADSALGVDCKLDDATSPATIEIVWTEQGGPPVTLPSRRGFGSNLLEIGLAQEFGGATKLRFEPNGLICEMRFALSAKFEAP